MKWRHKIAPVKGRDQKGPAIGANSANAFTSDKLHKFAASGTANGGLRDQDKDGWQTIMGGRRPCDRPESCSARAQSRSASPFRRPRARRV